MQGHVEDLVVCVEHVLGAVAVMYVPVQDEDPLQAVVGDGVPGSYRHVVEDTEPSAAVGLGVVTRGSDHGVPGLGLSANQMVETLEDTTGRQPGAPLGSTDAKHASCQAGPLFRPRGKLYVEPCLGLLPAGQLYAHLSHLILLPEIEENGGK